MSDETPKPSADEHAEEYRDHRRARGEGETDDATLGEVEEGDPTEEPAERRKRMHRPEEEVPRDEEEEEGEDDDVGAGGGAGGAAGG